MYLTKKVWRHRGLEYGGAKCRCWKCMDGCVADWAVAHRARFRTEILEMWELATWE